MSQNPVLLVLKVVGITILAILVGLVFWQRNKLEDKIVDLEKETSGLKDQVDKSTRVSAETLKTLKQIQEALAKGGGSGGGIQIEREKTPEDYAWGDSPPPWVKGRAADLWGQHPNYLKPDPDWPDYLPLEDPRLNPNGEMVRWYGSQPPDINAFTLNESDFNVRVRTYVQDYLGYQHSQNPYLYRPGLAYRVQVSPDYKTWVFYLRPKVKWHTPEVDLDKYPHLKGDHFLLSLIHI